MKNGFVSRRDSCVYDDVKSWNLEKATCSVCAGDIVPTIGQNVKETWPLLQSRFFFSWKPDFE